MDMSRSPSFHKRAVDIHTHKQAVEAHIVQLVEAYIVELAAQRPSVVVPEQGLVPEQGAIQ
jgi:hypothetical protein